MHIFWFASTHRVAIRMSVDVNSTLHSAFRMNAPRALAATDERRTIYGISLPPSLSIYLFLNLMQSAECNKWINDNIAQLTAGIVAAAIA